VRKPRAATRLPRHFERHRRCFLRGRLTGSVVDLSWIQERVKFEIKRRPARRDGTRVMLVKRGTFGEESTLFFQGRHSRRLMSLLSMHTRLTSRILDLCDPASRCDFLMLASVHVRLVSDIGRHDFTRMRSETWLCLFALSCLVLLISKITVLFSRVAVCSVQQTRFAPESKAKGISVTSPLPCSHSAHALYCTALLR
jgi:hypothetical protein